MATAKPLPVSFRPSPTLKKALEESAAKNFRSLSGEIEFRLTEAMKAEGILK